MPFLSEIENDINAFAEELLFESESMKSEDGMTNSGHSFEDLLDLIERNSPEVDKRIDEELQLLKALS